MSCSILIRWHDPNARVVQRFLGVGEPAPQREVGGRLANRSRRLICEPGCPPGPRPDVPVGHWPRISGWQPGPAPVTLALPDCFRGCSSMVERQLPKLHTRVRFPSPAFLVKRGESHPSWSGGFVGLIEGRCFPSRQIRRSDLTGSGVTSGLGALPWTTSAGPQGRSLVRATECHSEPVTGRCRKFRRPRRTPSPVEFGGIARVAA